MALVSTLKIWVFDPPSNDWKVVEPSVEDRTWVKYELGDWSLEFGARTLLNDRSL